MSARSAYGPRTGNAQTQEPRRGGTPPLPVARPRSIPPIDRGRCASAGTVDLVGWYGERLLPRLVDRACGIRGLQPLRNQVCAGLHGRVVELGFGSGLNVPHYPDAVTSVAAIEPADRAWRLATDRRDASAIPVERAGRDGQQLPLPDASCDTALSTWTLCTIPDVDAALAEVRRVLKPGGTLHFVEHGLAPDAPVRRWQHRLEPLQRRFAGGCHLTRDVVELLTTAGFAIDAIDSFYEPTSPKRHRRRSG